MPSYSRIATRLRVPLGFLFAIGYLWLAHPDWIAIVVGSTVIAVGVGIRATASGHIRKNAQLATTGPYAYTRNPLYLGSLMMAAGFIIAARSVWIAVGACVLFFAVYLPVIFAEEKYLRAAFPEYADYAAHVPRLLPRPTPYRPVASEGLPQFSRELYLRHREYNSILGSLLMLSALILKMLLFKR